MGRRARIRENPGESPGDLVRDQKSNGHSGFGGQAKPNTAQKLGHCGWQLINGGRRQREGRKRGNTHGYASPSDAAHILGASIHDAGQTKIRHGGLRLTIRANNSSVDCALRGGETKRELRGRTEKVTGPRVRPVRMQGETEERTWRNRILQTTRSGCRCTTFLCCPC